MAGDSPVRRRRLRRSQSLTGSPLPLGGLCLRLLSGPACERRAGSIVSTTAETESGRTPIRLMCCFAVLSVGWRRDSLAGSLSRRGQAGWLRARLWTARRRPSTLPPPPSAASSFHLQFRHGLDAENAAGRVASSAPSRVLAHAATGIASKGSKSGANYDEGTSRAIGHSWFGPAGSLIFHFQQQQQRQQQQRTRSKSNTCNLQPSSEEATRQRQQQLETGPSCHRRPPSHKTTATAETSVSRSHPKLRLRGRNVRSKQADSKQAGTSPMRTIAASQAAGPARGRKHWWRH